MTTRKSLTTRRSVITKPILHKNLPIIEVAESYILDMLFADKQAGPLLLTRISDRVAVADPENLDALQKRLLKLGHTPKIEK